MKEYVLKNGLLLIDKMDNRYKEYISEKEKTGISPDELWSLDHSLSIFLLPRLKTFKERKGGYPAHLGSVEKWDEILESMIKAFTIIANDEHCFPDEARQKILDTGLDNFSKYLMDLWS